MSRGSPPQGSTIQHDHSGPGEGGDTLNVGEITVDDINLEDNDSLDFGTGDDVGASFDPAIGGAGAWVVQDQINTRTFFEGRVGDALVFDDLPARFEDGVELRFGTGGDATVQYDGMNLLVNPRAVGTGLLVLSAGDMRFDGIAGTPTFGAHDHTAAGMAGVPASGLATPFSDLAALFTTPVDAGAGVDLNADGRKLRYGAGDDVSSRYDAGEDELKWRDETGAADRMSLARTSGDLVIAGTFTETGTP